MSKKLLIIMAIIFASIMVNSLAAQTEINEIKKDQGFEKRISEMEKMYDTQVALLIKAEEQLKQDFQNKKNELINSFNELKNEQTKIFNEVINQQKFWLYIVSTIVGLLFAGSFFAAFCKFFREKVIIKILAKNFEIEAENMADLLKEVKTDYTLKRNKKILVATPANHDDQFIKAFFKKMGFSMAVDSQDNTPGVKFIQFSSGQPPEEGADLILFNDEKGLSGTKTAEELSEKTEINKYFSSYSGQETFCFYFGPKRIDPLENIQLTFANARLQLYGNLMNALRSMV